MFCEKTPLPSCYAESYDPECDLDCPWAADCAADMREDDEDEICEDCPTPNDTNCENCPRQNNALVWHNDDDGPADAIDEQKGQVKE